MGKGELITQESLSFPTELSELLADLNPRQESFARLIAEGKCSKKDAAVRAGYAQKSCSVSANNLLGNPAVARAITLLKIEHQEKTNTTKEDKRALLIQIAREQRLVNPGSSVAALVAMAKMDGDFREYRSTYAPIHIEFPEGASLVQKAELIIDAVALGQCAPDVATSLITALGATSKLIDAEELHKRVVDLETDVGQSKAVNKETMAKLSNLLQLQHEDKTNDQ